MLKVLPIFLLGSHGNFSDSAYRFQLSGKADKIYISSEFAGLVSEAGEYWHELVKLLSAVLRDFQCFS